MTSRRLLVVPYYYPPFSGSGNRWPTLVRYLRLAGHDVTVVATDAYGRLSEAEETGVVRVRDVRSLKPLRRMFRRGDAPETSQAGTEAPPGKLLTNVFVPDAHVVGWLPAALGRVRGILARSSFDVIITSGPPESTHLIGLLLGDRRPAWIADFRDGWCFEPLRDPFPTRPQRTLDAWLERRVAQTAERVIAATSPISEDLARRLGARAVCVPNAWDPELTIAVDEHRPSADPSVRLVYTGTFSGVRGSDPEPFLRALAAVRAEHSTRPIRLVVAGPLSNADKDLIETTGAGDAIQYLGVLGRMEALALQRSADALLLFTSRNRSEATGKLFEYIGAGRPVLALAADNEAARIVQETNIGITVPPDDVEEIAAGLRRFASGQMAAEYAPHGIERFTYPAPADAIAGLVEEALAERARRRRARS